jgi:PAS domain S-box-containing protein
MEQLINTSGPGDDITFRKLVHNSYSGITLLDKDFKTIYQSASAERITGWNTAAGMKNSMEELIFPADREMVSRVLQEVLLSPNVPKTCSFQSRNFKGHYIWLECTFTNMLGEPDVNAIVCNFMDTTDKKKAEELLQHTRQELSTYKYALDESAIVAITDQKGVITHVNDNFCKISKYNRDELIGQDHRIINSSYHDKDFIREIWLSIANGKIWKGEIKNKAKDGSNYWVDTTIVPFLNDKGRPYQYVAIRSDITERKLNQEKIAESERFTKTITDNLPAMITYWTADLHCLFANKALQEWFEKTPQEMQGIAMKDLMKSDEFSLCLPYVKNVLNGKVQSFEHSFYKRGSKTIYTHTQYVPDIHYGKVKGFYSLSYDYSELRSAELHRKSELLQKALLSEISLTFNEDTTLNDTLDKILEQLVDFAHFSMAEAWLIGTDKKEIRQLAKFSKKGDSNIFFRESTATKTFVKGTGLPGITWEAQTVQFWQNIDQEKNFVRRAAAKKAGLKSAYGLPLFYNTEMIGVLVLGLDSNEDRGSGFNKILENLGSHLGAEIKRKQLEQELNQVFNFTPDILCIANTDGYFKKVNPAMGTLLEYSEDELLSRPFMEFVHPDDIGETATELDNIIHGNPTYYIENRYITKSGKIKWLAWTTTGASEQGTLYCSAKDITEKKDLEVLLQKANSLARIGSWEIDMLKDTVYWSAITREIHETAPDFEPDLATGINFYKDGISREIITLKLKEMIEKGAICDVELQIVTSKGNTKWIRVIGEAEFSDNKCVRVYGSFQDIDALKKAEIAAKVTLEERNTILESIGDAFFAVDENWVITYWNKTAENVLGKTREEMMGNNLWDIFSDSIESASYKKYHQAVESNLAAHFEDYYAPLNKWHEISAYPTGNGLSVYFKDITERKMSENNLRRLNEELRKHAKELAISNAELEQFAYVASHDLQEPLRMVTSFLTQLEQKYGDIVDDKGKKYIHFAVDGAKRMRQIILDLLEFSRVGRSEDSMEEVNTGKVINDILALYRKQIEEQKAHITFENLPRLQTYRVAIRQVFQNLISNALKYQKNGAFPVINISCTETKEHWQFAVKDNGIGIDPEYFDKVFIIFQRLHNKDEYSGTGMGLAVTKKIVENLGGKIWLESEEGKGSTFYFTILKNNL